MGECIVGVLGVVLIVCVQLYVRMSELNNA